MQFFFIAHLIAGSSLGQTDSILLVARIIKLTPVGHDYRTNLTKLQALSTVVRNSKCRFRRAIPLRSAGNDFPATYCVMLSRVSPGRLDRFGAFLDLLCG